MQRQRIISVPFLQDIIIFLIIFFMSVLTSGSSKAAPEEKICTSMQIRHEPSQLLSLRHCRVINGSLVITLIDSNKDRAYENLTFPGLVEITDYLLLYRVNGLKSLADIFPNLRIIRGNDLINNYALIIYEVMQLQEIGLRSLTTIVRGGVRIERNPLLCFVETINWQIIANGTQIGNHFIAANRPTYQCPICESNTNSKYLNSNKNYCWNRQYHQIICPSVCGQRSCDSNGNCFDDISESIPKPLEANQNQICELSNGECKRECDGGHIVSTSTASYFSGCSVINGTLIINIRQCEQNISKHLEEFLSQIEEIKGSLRIIGSYPLMSLSFLKKLKVIRGLDDDSIYNNGYALYVMDNENLENLFDHNVTFERGKLFFRYNSKLCLSNIEELKSYVLELKDVNQLDVEDVINGDKFECHVKKLTSIATSITYYGAITNTESLKYVDDQVLLGYHLYYKSTPYKNVTIYDSRDICGDDGWHIKEVLENIIHTREDKTVQIVLTDLKPFTQYAYYVIVHTTEPKRIRAITDIQYFTTLPSTPEPVQNLKLTANGSSSMIVTWQPPKAVNGPLISYIVQASLIFDNLEHFDQRNYCTDSLEKSENVYPTEVWIQYEEEDIDFISELQNVIYVKRAVLTTERYKRRSIIDRSPFLSEDSDNSEMMKVNNNNYEEFYENVNDSTNSFVLHNLRHFSAYLVSVQACRHYDDHIEILKYPICSEKLSAIQRTLKNENGDNIEFLSFRKSRLANSSATSIELIWKEPKNPNSIAISYIIRYARVDVKSLIMPTYICITRQMFLDSSGTFTLSPPLMSNGNYSIEVSAITLAGNGKFTPPIYLVIDDSSHISSTTIMLCILLGLAIVIGSVWVLLRRKYAKKSINQPNFEVVGMLNSSKP